MSSATVTSIRPDATPGMRIDEVRVVDRHRSDLGDIDALAASIRDVGLLQPIVVTRDGRLVAGQRRLEAGKRLGWTAIPVVYAENLHDAVSRLTAERDENVCRKDMLPSELAALGEALYSIEEERSKARQREHGGTAPGRRTNTEGTHALSVDEGAVAKCGKTSAAVGPALGMSGRTYSELRYVHVIANDPDRSAADRQRARNALERMDQGAGITGEARRLRRRAPKKVAADHVEPPREAAEQPEPHEQSEREEDWIPAQGDNSPKGAARRRELIRELAARGWSSRQIGAHINMLANTVRRVARAQNIPMPADEALGRNTRKTVDSNRVIRETVGMFSGLELALSLVNFDDLDRAEIPNWTASLSDSIRVLNRLNKQLKEVAQ